MAAHARTHAYCVLHAHTAMFIPDRPHCSLGSLILFFRAENQGYMGSIIALRSHGQQKTSNLELTDFGYLNLKARPIWWRNKEICHKF